MGNSKSDLLTPGSLKKAERELLEYSGLDAQSYEVRKVHTNEEKTEYMTTILVGDSRKPKLVLIHGFAGSGALFYKVMKGLAENFFLVIVDLIGMGSSSRPEWNCRTPEEADDYFVRVIETWRQNLNITDFNVGAHSYGGYIFGTYAAAYPQHIRKLVLLSPLGVK